MTGKWDIQDDRRRAGWRGGGVRMIQERMLRMTEESLGW